ncbi:hypothetical protein E2K93_10600 [Thalassotalea sp. HSM 43]|uniref:penicillin-binding protein activator n=1 Tax=Thalassotalea sp. HSM 43 TaxID=2552945 RepID=UPI001081FC3D|nr:penicillin-binding protein activator [Thalassotalea sp. HSM 43]QBY04806.1 hypothetical protein E2K93_10600 [Thalassotalea sp. HSM 43]
MTIKITAKHRNNLLLAAVSSALLFACASPQQEKPPVKVNEPITEVKIEQPKSELSADDLLSKAETAEIDKAIVYLLQAADKYIDQQQLGKSLHLSNQLSRLSLTQSQQNYNLLNSAEALFELGELDLAKQQLAEIDSAAPTERQLYLNAQVHQQLGLSVEAISAYLTFYQNYPSSEINDIEGLYELIASLQPWQKSALKKQPVEGLNGWLAFDTALAQNGDNAVQLNKALSQWQSRYSEHPANQLLTKFSGLANELDKQPKVTSIAVLLPLSGREKSVGSTIQAGIIAAYDGQRELNFIDTNSAPMATLILQLQQQSPDVVIGPLLKRHVDSYLQIGNEKPQPSFSSISSEASLNPSPMSPEPSADVTENTLKTGLSYPWQTLLLNLPDQQQLQDNQFALSMLPEDEAEQAAFTLSKKGFNNAMVLSQNNAIGKRIAQSFANQWFQQTGTEITVVYYPPGKQMQNAVKSSMDVGLSDERIYLMRNRIKENVKSEARSRRDVDMIYLIASTDQARLVKPYIDVNISPFAEAIPVFASSRSHDKRANRNTRRDLSGLVFTDSPWLLPGMPENDALYSEAQQLWPNRSSQMERFYAMGIDSIQLLDKLSAMELIPSIVHNGETGDLKMNQSRVISRSLSWAKFRSSRVSPLAME